MRLTNHWTASLRVACLLTLLLAATTIPLDGGSVAHAYDFLSTKCHSLYQKRWKRGLPHKAIAVLVLGTKELCGFSDGYVSRGRARSIALAQCAEQARAFKVNPKRCRIVEEQ